MEVKRLICQGICLLSNFQKELVTLENLKNASFLSLRVYSFLLGPTKSEAISCFGILNLALQVGDCANSMIRVRHDLCFVREKRWVVVRNDNVYFGLKLTRTI